MVAIRAAIRSNLSLILIIKPHCQLSMTRTTSNVHSKCKPLGRLDCLHQISQTRICLKAASLVSCNFQLRLCIHLSSFDRSQRNASFAFRLVDRHSVQGQSEGPLVHPRRIRYAQATLVPTMRCASKTRHLPSNTFVSVPKTPLQNATPISSPTVVQSIKTKVMGPYHTIGRI